MVYIELGPSLVNVVHIMNPAIRSLHDTSNSIVKPAATTTNREKRRGTIAVKDDTTPVDE